MSLPGTKRRFVAAQDLRQLSVLSEHAARSFLLSQALMLITSGKPSISATDFKD
jgi:peroxiredoxin